MKNKKVYIISGTAVLICIIALVAVFTGSGSVSARVKKQIDLGTKYLLEGNYQEAVLAFEKVIRIDPKNVDARLGLAEAYIALDRTEDA
ncbi:MAG TPA: tetratricopeptide repeat protein, partial [Thermoclostridium sp.]